MESESNLYAVIMAGGRGSRFWPRSRKRRSKQILNIIGNRTMIQDTAARLRPLFPPGRTFVVTNKLLAGEIAAQLPEIPEKNILIEPAARSTAPCIGLAAAHILHECPDAIMGVFPADHMIGKEKAFREDVRAAIDVAKRGGLVTFGIPPVKPETGFGYIEKGEPLEGFDGIFSVKRFVEKPDAKMARSFVDSGSHWVNSGMFVWRAKVFFEEAAKHLPEMTRRLEAIAENVGSPLEIKTLGENYPKIDSVSVDKGMLEKSGSVFVKEASFPWNDVGSWDALYNVWPMDDEGNVSVGDKMSIDTNGTLIYSPKKFVATIGLKDIMIVETDDALLVCSRDRAQDVSRIVDLLREKKMEEYL